LVGFTSTHDCGAFLDTRNCVFAGDLHHLEPIFI
jgi:hypothetical protein